MVEQQPEPEKRKPIETKEIEDSLKRLARYPANIAWRISIYICLVATPEVENY